MPWSCRPPAAHQHEEHEEGEAEALQQRPEVEQLRVERAPRHEGRESGTSAVPGEAPAFCYRCDPDESGPARCAAVPVSDDASPGVDPGARPATRGAFGAERR